MPLLRLHYVTESAHKRNISGQLYCSYIFFVLTPSEWSSIDPLFFIFFRAMADVFVVLECLGWHRETEKKQGFFFIFFFYICNGFLLSSLSPGILPMFISKCHRNASREIEAFTRTPFSRAARLGDAAGLGSPRELLHYLSHLQMPAPFILLISSIRLHQAY